MKKKYCIGLLVCVASFGAQAGTITDNYNGGLDGVPVIGDAALFDISSLTANRVGNTLTVEVYTAFAGNAGVYPSLTVGNKGIGYGDLFIAGAWNPFGSAPYSNDIHSNGTLWQFGFALDNRWNNNGGTGTLYALNGTNNQNSLLSDDFFVGGNWRDHQEVAVDTGSATVVNLGLTGTWTVDPIGDVVRFVIDVSGTALANDPTVAFHWGMTCANDVIEGETTVVSVAAADMAPVLGFTLLGLLVAGSRRRVR